MTRLEREHNNGILAGFRWMVTFNSDEGDVPLLQFDRTPSAGTDIVATESKTFLSGTLHVTELVKGQFTPVVQEISGLTAGEQYSVCVCF